MVVVMRMGGADGYDEAHDIDHVVCLLVSYGLTFAITAVTAVHGINTSFCGGMIAALGAK